MGNLCGDLSLMPLEKVLHWALVGKRNGVLTLSNGSRGKKLYLKDGHIVLRGQAGQGGATAPDQKADALVELVARALREPMSWSSGTFEFVQNTPLPRAGGSSVALPISRILSRVAELEAAPGAGLEDEQEALIEQVGQRIMDGDFELPPMPDIILKIHRCLNDEHGSAREVVRIITADQVLTSKILKAVNSAFYSLANPVTSVRHAIVCLGYKTVQGIVTAQTLGSLFVRNREAVRKVLQHGFKCAYLARAIAAEAGANEEEAFVCGLLHNIGKTVLMNLCGDYGLSREAGEQLADRYHQQVGVLLAAKWNLPELVIETIEFHHAPAQSRFPGPAVELVHLADGLLKGPEMPITHQHFGKHLDFSRISIERIQEQVPQIEAMAVEMI